MKRVLATVVLIILVGFGIYYYLNENNKLNQPIACTADAKMCPDGSYVGRVGPNCEFAECPKPGDWPEITDPQSGIKFKYPPNLGTEYINPIEWPPKLTYVPNDFFCNESLEGAQGTTTVSVEINGRHYCKQTLVLGAAGTVYTTYNYVGDVSGRLVDLNFTLRAIQCQNYDDPDKTKCLNEREGFDIDSVVDRIFGNIQN